MSRVIIDSGVFGEQWLKKVLPAMEADEKVRFTYTPHPKMLGELEKAKKLGGFYKIMGELGRRDDVPLGPVQKHIAKVESARNWRNCSDCDDPHIFAMVYLMPTKFVFTSDKRLAQCRKRMNRSIDSKYCNFRCLQDRKSYMDHRTEVHS